MSKPQSTQKQQETKRPTGITVGLLHIFPAREEHQAEQTWLRPPFFAL